MRQVPMLTKEEREKFAAWCETRASAEDKLAEQLRHISTQLYKQRAVEVLALHVVAKLLRSLEST